VTVGDTVTLSVTAISSDGGTLSYQWYSNTTNSTSGGAVVDGATNALFYLFTDAISTLYYYVVVTNTNTSVDGEPNASTTSNVAVVTVNNSVNAAKPTITVQPQSRTVSAGGSVNLSVTATSSDDGHGGQLSYKWYSNTTNTNTGGTEVGINSNSYTFLTSTEGTLYYYVVVTNTNTNATGARTATTPSNVAIVTVTPPMYDNADLQSLTVSIGTLSPAFDADSMHYTLLLPCDYNSVTITAGASINGTVSYLVDNQSKEMPLVVNVGATTLLVRSTAADGATSKNYIVDIIHPFSADFIWQYWDNILAVNLKEMADKGYDISEFQWRKNGDDIVGATGAYLHLNTSVLDVNAYSVALRIDGQTIPVCQKKFATFSKVNATGIRAYPNPIRNRQFTLETGQFSEGVNIAIYNSTGMLMRTDRVSGGATTVVDVADIPVGVYVVRVGGQSAIIVIEK
jgi:hypothetical protein